MKKKIILTYTRVMLWFGVLLMWAALYDTDSLLRYFAFIAGSLMMITAPVLYVWVQGKRDSYWES